MAVDLADGTFDQVIARARKAPVTGGHRGFVRPFEAVAIERLAWLRRRTAIDCDQNAIRRRTIGAAGQRIGLSACAHRPPEGMT